MTTVEVPLAFFALTFAHTQPITADQLSTAASSSRFPAHSTLGQSQLPCTDRRLQRRPRQRLDQPVPIELELLVLKLALNRE